MLFCSFIYYKNYNLFLIAFLPAKNKHLVQGTVTVQAMPLFPQTRKTISFPVWEADGFLLVRAPAPSPGEQKLFWTTIRSGPATRLKIARIIF